MVPPNHPVHLLFHPRKVLERRLFELLGTPSNTKLCHGYSSIAFTPVECRHPPQEYSSRLLLPQQPGCRDQTTEGSTTSTVCLCKSLCNSTRDLRFDILPAHPLHLTCPNHPPPRILGAIFVLVSRTAAPRASEAWKMVGRMEHNMGSCKRRKLGGVSSPRMKANVDREYLFNMYLNTPPLYFGPVLEACPQPHYQSNLQCRRTQARNRPLSRTNTSNTPTAQLHFKKVIEQLLPLLPEEKRPKVRC